MMRICRRTRLKRKAFIVLFLYTMAFGYMYTFFMQYIVFDESLINSESLMGRDSQINLNITKKSQTTIRIQKKTKRNVTQTPKPVKNDPKLKTTKKPTTHKPRDDVIKLVGSPRKSRENLLKKSYEKEFKYPMHIDLAKLIRSQEAGNKSFIVPINPHNYHFLYTPTHLCKYGLNASYPKVVILVKSAAKNTERRAIIRSTWGSVHYQNIHIVFLLGLPNNGNLMIRKEHSMYGDIVQEDFIDNYWNNTVKMVMAYKWAVTNCDQADHLFFVDDDYFVNIDNLMKYLSTKQVKETKELFSGTLLSRSVPYRVNGSKWFMSWEDYPFDRWPPYVAGGAYFVSIAAARKFNLAFPYVKTMHIDDTYLGIVAKKIGIKPSSNRLVGYRKMPMNSLNRLIACHGYASRQDVEKAWSHVKEGKQKPIIQHKEKVPPQRSDHRNIKQ